MQGGILKKHDRLAVADRSRSDHAKRLVDIDFHHGDVLTLVFVTATCGGAVAGFVFADEEVQAFGDRPPGS